MSDPSGMPFQDDERPDGADELYEGQRPILDEPAPASPEASDLLPPASTETDSLAAQVSGPDDRRGMAELWRATMALPHWWFIAVGEEGLESPAAAEIDGQLMLLTFTNAERARHFAVQNGMIAPDDDLQAIALPPSEVVESAEIYEGAGIGGLMFDPHLTGYFIPSEQLPIVWAAVDSDEPTAAG